MQEWLGEIDGGNADRAWSEASPSLAGTAKDAALARQKAGSFTSRTLVSVGHHDKYTGPDGMTVPGPVVAGRFLAVFESTTLQETVMALKTGAHSWQISSYEEKVPDAAAPVTASR